MPYAVWLELTAPEPIPDALARARLPQVVIDLLEAGWEAPAPVLDDLAADHLSNEDTEPGLLDVRVLTHPEGMFVGLAVDTEIVDVALSIGASLGRHLAGSAPALLGWTVEEIRAERLTTAAATGDWLPPLNGDRPRFPVAEHLPHEFRELAAQYLLAGAVRDLGDPTGRTSYTRDAVNTADLVAGAVAEPYWARDLVGELGTLLVAAGRAEAAGGERRRLVGHGGGDLELAGALLACVRAEIAHPTTGHADDGMRGHVLLDRFMTERDLHWDRPEHDGDPHAGDQLGQDRLRALLWAGLRVLLTLTQDRNDDARSPWRWLAELSSDDVDPVVDVLAERDTERLEIADQDDAAQLSAAARAHVVVAAALRRPRLLEEDAATSCLEPLLSDGDVTGGPLNHLVIHVLLSVGATGVERARAATVAGHEDTAALLWSVLATLHGAKDARDDGASPFDDLRRGVAELLPGTADPDATRDVLRWLSVVAGGDAARIADDLLAHPAELAAVVLSSFDIDDEDERRQRTYILAEAAAVDTDLAACLAGHSPALRSSDPRDEPAYRNEVAVWRARFVDALGRIDEDETPWQSPEVVGELLPGGAELPPHVPTAEAARVTLRAISAVSIALCDPDLPASVLL